MIQGNYSDGKTSRLVGATLQLEGVWVVIRDTHNTILQQTAPQKIVLSSRLGNTHRTINFADADAGAQFETNDNDGIDRLFISDRPSASLLHKLETHLGMIAMAAVFSVVFVFWVVAYVVPVGASALAHGLPDALVESTGEHTLTLMDNTYFEPSELSEAEQIRVRNVLAPHILQGSASLHFRKWMPNALALPDGSIVFTDELVQLAEHDEELIAIAYHELGHVEHRHLIRRSLQGSSIAILLFILTGDVSNVDLLVTVPAVLMDLAYSREFEVEADRHALQAMTEAGIDPTHFKNIMLRLDNWYSEEIADEDRSTGVLKYLYTHPQTDERIAMIDRYIALTSG